MTPHKTCKDCRQDKPLTAFTRHGFSKDGHVHTCNACRSTQAAEKRGDTTLPPAAPWRPDMPQPAWGWQNYAACRGEDTALFYGPEGERGPERQIRERQARAVCIGCPVRADCLDYAISRPERWGTWGGLNEEQRSAERRRRMRRAA